MLTTDCSLHQNHHPPYLHLHSSRKCVKEGEEEKKKHKKTIKKRELRTRIGKRLGRLNTVVQLVHC